MKVLICKARMIAHIYVNEKPKIVIIKIMKKAKKKEKKIVYFVIFQNDQK